MAGLIVALGAIIVLTIVFAGGFFLGVSTVMRKLPPGVRARLAAGQVWRGRP